MASSLSNLVDNLAEGTQKTERKYGYGNKKLAKIVNAFLNTQGSKMI